MRIRACISTSIFILKLIIAVAVITAVVYITWDTLDNYFHPVQYEDDSEILRKA